MKRSLVGIFSLMLMLAASVPVAAQETEEAPVEDLSALNQAREDLAAIDEHMTSIREMNNPRNTPDEDRELLRISAMDRIETLLGLLKDLERQLPKIVNDEGKADSVLSATATHLEELSAFNTSAFDRIVGIIDDLRARRTETAPADLVELESLISHEIDLALLVLNWNLDTVQMQKRLELVPDVAWESFDAQLKEIGDDLASRAQVVNKESKRLRGQLAASEKASSGADVVSDNRLRLQAADQRREGIVSGLERTIRLMESRQIDPSIYRQAVIQATGKVTEGILDPEVLKGLISQAWRSTTAWLKETGPSKLVQIALLVLVVIAFRALARALWWLLLLLRRGPKSMLAKGLAQRMILPLGTLAGLFTGLWILGANPATLLTGLGVASVIIGLALQDTLGNLAAGFFILMYRPYDVDHAIKVGGELGLVKAMGLANTTIVTFDNRRLYVPNRKIWSEVIENRSTEASRRVSATLRVSYDDDLDRVIELVSDYLEQHALVLKEPAPAVFVEKLGSSWIELAVWPWSALGDWWTLYTTLPRELLELLNKEGIRMPYARQSISLENPGGAGGDDV